MDLNRRVEAALGQSFQTKNSVGGGCIATSTLITAEDGSDYFLKSLAGKGAMFRLEANGLLELSKANAIRVPEVIHADDDFIILEVIRTGHQDHRFMETFGRQFAEMHRLQSDSFGFYEDNYIGATPQENSRRTEEWAEFYWESRLLYQFKRAERHGYSSSEMTDLASKLEHALPALLRGSEESPCILHGDLWSGNFMVGADGEPVLIDPAVYYGHREADLGMTHLFGGFSHSFYRAYNEAYPLPAGHERRIGLYMLYHILNHLNLFGMGYYSQAIRTMRQYV
ncbi:fructosamine kinase [bacterium F16]|nr:fructosamine kinase [bacterium F16]